MKISSGKSIFAAAALAFVMVSCGGSSNTDQPAASGGGAAAPAGQPVDVATAGTVTGTIKLDGAVPAAHKINMTADAYCLSQHSSSPAMDQEVVAGAGGTLANVVVYIQEDMSKYAFTTPSDPAKIDQSGCQYVPHIVAMMAGQTLQVTNSDKTTHNIHPIPKDNREWNESQAPNTPPLMKVFARAENGIPVKCNVHPWMKSYIFAFKNPYFFVTGNDGKFTIGNLPPGTYTIVAWQEKFGTVTQSVPIGPKDSKSVDLTFKAASGD
jgi:plastocyanin